METSNPAVNVNRSTRRDVVDGKAVTRFIRLREVIDRTSLSRSTIYALIQRELFPKQIRLSTHQSSVWVEHDVDNWINQQIHMSK